MNLEGWAGLFKYVGWTGAFLVLLSTIATTLLNDKLSGLKDLSSAEKDKRIDQLLLGQQDLNSSVQKYQKELLSKQSEIDDLSRRAANGERGIRTSYDFDGTCRKQVGTEFHTMVGVNSLAFKKLCELNSQNRWEELIAFASSVIKKHGEWLTPYFLRGCAYANLGHFQDAARDLKFVIAKAGDDVHYARAGNILKLVQEEMSKQGNTDNQ